MGRKMNITVAEYKKELIEEWHPIKNGNLTPYNTAYAMNNKVWWICPKDPLHDYEARVSDRTRKSKNATGCPYCAGRKVNETNSLAFLFPDLTLEWDVVRNYPLTPHHVSKSSNKKVWWKCRHNDEHEWKLMISKRTGRGDGCPYCSGKKVIEADSLFYKFPQLMQEWNFEKNNKLDPKKLSKGSNKKAWWFCQNGHEWETRIVHRTIHNTGCPYCSGHKVCTDNSLATLEPDIATEWDYDKNGNITPHDITYGSKYNAWWICDNGHSWRTTVGVRTNQKTGCPKCSIQTSFAEQVIFYYLNKLGLDVENRHQIELKGKRYEIDVFVKDLNICIEYDGVRFHQSKLDSDYEKTKIFLDSEFKFIRIRETGLPTIDISKCFNYICNPHIRKDIFNVIKTIIYNHFQVSSLPFVIDIKKDSRLILASYKKRKISLSLASQYPEIAKQWHPTKNGILTPEQFTVSSGIKFWWICDVADDHEWETTIASRTGGNGCPFCSGGRATNNNNIFVLNPNWMSEWHYEKNINFNPRKLKCSSNKRVWWKCEKMHEWEATIQQRNGKSKCPYCSNKRVCIDNCLLTINPSLAKEWHPTLNEELNPENVLPGSSKKAWWKCNKNHEWQAVISSRNKGTGCPMCSGLKGSPEDNLTHYLETLNVLWDYKRNQHLDPTNLRRSSNYSVWWICLRNHSWEDKICNIIKSIKGCPYCSHERPSFEYNLKIIHEWVGSIWNYEKNTDFPENLTPNNDKKRHWKCQCGYEWSQTVSHRVRSPYLCPSCKTLK